MDKIKNFMKLFIVGMGAALVGYHWTEGFAAFSNPVFSNLSFTLAIIFWLLPILILIKKGIQDDIRDKWKKGAIAKLQCVCIILIAFCIGCIIANLDVLGSMLTLKEMLPIIIIPFASTILYGLKPDKEKGGWIGEVDGATPGEEVKKGDLTKPTMVTEAKKDTSKGGDIDN